MKLTDSHCHLPPLNRKQELENILSRAHDADVTRMINIGTSLKSSARALEVASLYDGVFSTAAVYPHEEQDKSLLDIQSDLEGFVRENRSQLVAIGETGLDISDRKDSRLLDDQKSLFEFQVELSREFDLPLIVHNRDADKQILRILQSKRPKKGVIHCFTSDWEFAKKVFDLNFLISFSGIITYNSGRQLLDIVKKVPLDKFLIETDSPYLPPQGHRNEKNEPGYVRIVAQKVADVKGISLDEVAACSSENAEALFSL